MNTVPEKLYYILKFAQLLKRFEKTFIFQINSNQFLQQQTSLKEISDYSTFCFNEFQYFPSVSNEKGATTLGKKPYDRMAFGRHGIKEDLSSSQLLC